jgi:hypothetical protein
MGANWAGGSLTPKLAGKRLARAGHTFLASPRIQSVQVTVARQTRESTPFEASPAGGGKCTPQYSILQLRDLLTKQEEGPGAWPFLLSAQP